MAWYKQKLDEIFSTLNTSPQGLSSEEAKLRLKKYGLNQLTVKQRSIWSVIIEPFKSIFMGILALAALISWLTGAHLDAIIIGIIVVINAVIFYTQHWATSRVLRSLKKHGQQTVSVVRAGQNKSVNSVELVPGDIVYLEEGERIPADARVIEVDNLQINEASLTGESVPIHKNAEAIFSSKQIYEQINTLFQGSYVIAGTGLAVVVETGNKTEYGKIAALATKEVDKSPVQEKIDNLVRGFIRVIAVFAVAVFSLSLVRGMPTAEALRFMLSFSVSAVPEGLPVALTVIIVLGMRRMARHKALVRSFKAIEDIGQITTIATDKTGTLTKNHLSVIDSWSIEGQDVSAVAARSIGANSKSKDPLDKAIAEYLPKSKQFAVDELYPFDSALRMSGSFIKQDAMLYIKGSPEHLLAKSKLSPERLRSAQTAMHELGAHGYRVIAFGTQKVRGGEMPVDLSEVDQANINFVGFLAFADGLRKEAASAISDAKAAGISVRLITGDQPETALTIGKKVGLAYDIKQVIVGKDLPTDKKALAAVIEDKTIFARILPKDKYRILEALKQHNITAMTGDGVNDVPALSNAHVGIAMGSGSDIAKDAGGIVLLNDNFKTIVTAVSEGRIIFDNIRRMLFYILSTSAGEVATMIGALLIGLPLPVTAIQILWINLVTDTAMELPLGLEPAEDGHMKRPPRNPKDPLLGKILTLRIVLVGITMAIVTLATVYWLRLQNHDLAYIQTVAFLTLIAGQWVNAFNARSEYASSFTRLKRANYGLLVGFGIAFGLQMLVMFGPLQSAFGIQSVSLSALLIPSIIMSISVLIVVEIHKLYVRHNRKLQ